MRIAWNGASASSWLITPIPPTQVRWRSRYDGGRLSLIATVYAGSLGLLIRWNCPRIHSRVKRNRSSFVGSTNGER